MVYSKWQNTINRDINSLIDHIMSYSEWLKPSIDPFDNNNLTFRITKAFPKNESIQLDNETVEYNFLEFQFERVRNSEKSNSNREKRIKIEDYEIIIYSHKNKVKYIVNRGYAPLTLSVLRKLHGYEGKHEIKAETIGGIKSDLFIWLVYNLIENPSLPLGVNSNLYLKSLTGFMGKTEDKINTIQGTGKRILNMLTTLLFLFENQNISKVNLEIKEDDHFYDITLGEESFIDVSITDYEGPYMFGIEEIVKSRILLRSFIELIPNLIKIFSYEQTPPRANWSEKKERAFFNEIGKTIKRNITELLKKK
ncbi:hypothetical protein [Enterococcus mundtii]|uniref:hypothetical protein n=1 Tax=Enterococcus mundtii TaxID=53346 RepID=UPI00300690FD